MRSKQRPEVGKLPLQTPEISCPACTHHRDQRSLNLQRKRLYYVLDRKWPRTKKERVGSDRVQQSSANNTNLT